MYSPTMAQREGQIWGSRTGHELRVYFALIKKLNPRIRIAPSKSAMRDISLYIFISLFLQLIERYKVS